MQRFYKLTAICLCAIIFLSLSISSAKSFVTVYAADTEPQPPFSSSYQQGDIIEFGSYPQTLVTDKALAEELSWYIEDDMWQSLGWYRGNNSTGSMYETDTAQFCDIDYYGEKYRAVTFSEYRAQETFLRPSSAYQAPLGYTTGNIYFFKFEPIKWRILDPSNGLLLAESILDAPAYSNTEYSKKDDAGDTQYYSDAECTHYSSNWEYSSLRSFLNNTFFDTAFTGLEQTLIGEIELTNNVVTNGDTRYSGNNTIDKVFILGINEIGYDEYYGLSNTLRIKNGTDYAQLHGLFPGTKELGTAAVYYLRDPVVSYTVAYVSEKGVISAGVDAASQDTGVVPSLCMNLESFEQLDLYDGINISFDNGVLTISGNGILPDRNASVTDILAPYTEKATAVIIKDGITEISENAFDGFIGLKTVIFEGDTIVQNNSFPDSFQLSTVIIKKSAALNGNPFSPDIYYVNIFKNNVASLTYENLPDGVSVHTYSYADSNVNVSDAVTLNTYEFFDLMAVLCDEFENITTVSFDSFTSADLVFYTYDNDTGEKTIIPDSVIADAKFSIEISVDGVIETVSFNEFCEMAADGTLDEFYLVTQSEAVGEIEDTEMEIKSFSDVIEYALKWIVSLLNKLFSLFSKLR